MRVDAHQHYWNLDANVNDWPTPDLKAIYRNFLPEDLEESLKKHQIDTTVLVQAAPNIEETELLLQMADQHPTIGGVVGWIDLASINFADDYVRLKRHPKFVGIRPMLQNLPDDKWILKAEVRNNIRLLIEDDFPIDLLIFPRHLPYIAELLEEFPTLRAVIDHCAKPNIKEKQWQDWADWMEKVAKHDSVMCKISGLVTEADHQSWKTEDFKRYIYHIIQCFGTKRLMFGSDWPVCLLAATYDEVVSIVEQNLPSIITKEEKDLLFGKNALQFYQLP